jgi:hypothetical protein
MRATFVCEAMIIAIFFASSGFAQEQEKGVTREKADALVKAIGRKYY